MYNGKTANFTGKNIKMPDNQTGVSKTLYLSKDVVKMLEKIAKEERRSLSFIANEYLTEYLVSKGLLKAESKK